LLASEKFVGLVFCAGENGFLIFGNVEMEMLRKEIEIDRD
jgi:hypothetical protein